MTTDIVVIRTFGTEMEAQIARAVLEANDVPAMILRDDAGGMYPPLTFVHGIRLVVRREDAELARELLDTAGGPSDAA